VEKNRNKPLLSIIVPIADFSREMHPIEKWLDDVNFSLCELIFIHDSVSLESKQSLKKVIENYESKSIQILEVDCKSPGLARNFGLSRASGEYIVFWDADDRPLPINVISAINQNDNSSNVIVGSFIRVAFANGQVQSTHHLRENHIPIQLALDPGIWRMIFKRELIENLRFKEYLMGEDAEFLCQIFSKLIVIRISKTIFYEYCVGSSFSLSASESKMRDIPSVIKDIYDICLKNAFRNEFTSAILLKLSLSYIKSLSFTRRIILILEIPKTHFRYKIRLLTSFSILLFQFLASQKELN
jgi:glycosyltransferase involved in cell wall biosynthesis